MKHHTTFETIPTLDLDAVTGGTLGPEPGVPDPGNDQPVDKCAGKGFLGSAICRVLDKLPPKA